MKKTDKKCTNIKTPPECLVHLRREINRVIFERMEKRKLYPMITHEYHRTGASCRGGVGRYIPSLH